MVRRKSKIFRSLPKYIKRKAKRVNKILDMWDAAGLTSNDLEMVKEMLSDFYADIGKTVKDQERASEQIHLKRSEKEEYNKILDFILYNDEVDLAKRTLKNQQLRESWNEVQKQIYEENKINWDYITDEQSFIDFVDRMNKTKNNRLLSAILDSKQFAELYSAGKSKGFKETEINKMIIAEYDENGATYDTLYKTIIGLIDR